MLANMGSVLAGEAPPFTPAGRASFAQGLVSHSKAEYRAGVKQVNQAGHRGILFRWRVNRRDAERLLPHPLEPVEHTDRPYLFINQSQSVKSREYLQTETPHLTNWHEAFIKIPCAFQGVRGTFLWTQYKDFELDYWVVVSWYRGITTKLARFSETFPNRGQPLNAEMEPGGFANMVISRFDERIITGGFRARRELTGSEIGGTFDLEEFFHSICLRYVPDCANPDGPPLVHDIPMWSRTSGAVARAWAGDAELVFGDSENEELFLLRPEEMLESYYVHLQYQEEVSAERRAPGRVIFDYIDRDGPGRAARPGGMGPHLKGVSPPFTFTGKAAFARSTHLGGDAGRGLARSGHSGILIHWRADRSSVEALLPRPLEPTAGTDQVRLFLNEAQLARPGTGAGDLAHAGSPADLNPNHVNWHEATISIPCAYRGTPGHYVWCVYKDVDHGVLLGMYDGMATKLAHFHFNFPFPAQPLNREMAPGGIARAAVSRFDERIITAEFEAARELTAEQVGRAFDPDGGHFNAFGVRYWPNYANPEGPPLVHDLVLWRLADADVSRAWSGTARVTLGTSPYEELGLLQPAAALESHFVYLHYGVGPGRCQVLHSYLDDPILA